MDKEVLAGVLMTAFDAADGFHGEWIVQRNGKDCVLQPEEPIEDTMSFVYQNESGKVMRKTYKFTIQAVKEEAL